MHSARSPRQSSLAGSSWARPRAGPSPPSSRATATPAGIDGDQTSKVRAQIKGGAAKNVILLIGDGMGDSEITVARNYAKGAAGHFAGIDALPLTGQYTTYALDKKDGLPDYVTDSAASGSGWATGTKTYNGAISVDVNGAPQRTLLEIARANGLRTGDVSTAELQDATPAVQVAHVPDRGCYAPSSTLAKCPASALQNGGLGSITEQLIDARADVTLGGGATSFNESAAAGQWSGKTLLQQAIGTRLPGRDGRRRPRRRAEGRPEGTGPRPVRAGQHAGALGRPGSPRTRAAPRRPRRARPTRSTSPRRPRSRR